MKKRQGDKPCLSPPALPRQEVRHLNHYLWRLCHETINYLRNRRVCKRLREECLRENKPLHRHTRFRRQELAQDEINPDVLAMSGHIARRCSEQKRVRIPAMKVSEWGHLLRALEIERVCH